MIKMFLVAHTKKDDNLFLLLPKQCKAHLPLIDLAFRPQKMPVVKSGANLAVHFYCSVAVRPTPNMEELVLVCAQRLSLCRTKE